MKLYVLIDIHSNHGIGMLNVWLKCVVLVKLSTTTSGNAWLSQKLDGVEQQSSVK